MLGGILSPLLRNLVINSLLILINSTQADSEGFADDVNFLIRGIDIDTIVDIGQQCLNRIRDWRLKTGLCFSPAKTEGILFTWKKRWTKTSPLHSGALLWGIMTFSKKNHIFFIYWPILTNDGLKDLGTWTLEYD